jgi:hypothetical protein
VLRTRDGVLDEERTSFNDTLDSISSMYGVLATCQTEEGGGRGQNIHTQSIMID